MLLLAAALRAHTLGWELRAVVVRTRLVVQVLLVVRAPLVRSRVQALAMPTRLQSRLNKLRLLLRLGHILQMMVLMTSPLTTSMMMAALGCGSIQNGGWVPHRPQSQVSSP